MNRHPICATTKPIVVREAVSLSGHRQPLLRSRVSRSLCYRGGHYASLVGDNAAIISRKQTNLRRCTDAMKRTLMRVRVGAPEASSVDHSASSNPSDVNPVHPADVKHLSRRKRVTTQAVRQADAVTVLILSGSEGPRRVPEDAPPSQSRDGSKPFTPKHHFTTHESEIKIPQCRKSRNSEFNRIGRVLLPSFCVHFVVVPHDVLTGTWSPTPEHLRPPRRASATTLAWDPQSTPPPPAPFPLCVPPPRRVRRPAPSGRTGWNCQPMPSRTPPPSTGRPVPRSEARAARRNPPTHEEAPVLLLQLLRVLRTPRWTRCWRQLGGAAAALHGARL